MRVAVPAEMLCEFGKHRRFIQSLGLPYALR
jgi:hypothetical protein